MGSGSVCSVKIEKKFGQAVRSKGNRAQESVQFALAGGRIRTHWADGRIDLPSNCEVRGNAKQESWQVAMRQLNFHNCVALRQGRFNI